MSRAFVDEDASSSREDEAPEIKIPVPPGSRNYLTKAGAEALSRELHELTGTERPRAQSRLAALTSPGASPAPDELAEARARAAAVDRRIAYLDAMAGLAEVVPPPPEGARDRVKFGALVRVRELPGGRGGRGSAGGPAPLDGRGQGGREIEYRIVGIDEADPDRGLIGWPSPVARALVGKRAGERAKVKLPSGELELLVLDIGYP